MRDNFYHHTRHCGLYIKKHVVLKYLSLVFCVLSRRILLGLYRCAEEKKWVLESYCLALPYIRT